MPRFPRVPQTHVRGGARWPQAAFLHSPRNQPAGTMKTGLQRGYAHTERFRRIFSVQVIHDTDAENGLVCGWEVPQGRFQYSGALVLCARFLGAQPGIGKDIFLDEIVFTR